MTIFCAPRSSIFEISPCAPRSFQLCFALTLRAPRSFVDVFALRAHAPHFCLALQERGAQTGALVPSSVYIAHSFSGLFKFNGLTFMLVTSKRSERVSLR